MAFTTVLCLALLNGCSSHTLTHTSSNRKWSCVWAQLSPLLLTVHWPPHNFYCMPVCCYLLRSVCGLLCCCDRITPKCPKTKNVPNCIVGIVLGPTQGHFLKRWILVYSLNVTLLTPEATKVECTPEGSPEMIHPVSNISWSKEARFRPKPFQMTLWFSCVVFKQANRLVTISALFIYGVFKRHSVCKTRWHLLGKNGKTQR